MPMVKKRQFDDGDGDDDDDELFLSPSKQFEWDQGPLSTFLFISSLVWFCARDTEATLSTSQCFPAAPSIRCVSQ
jgi:hypothetical protein